MRRERNQPMKPVQYFSPEYLARCREMTTGQILRFLDDFRRMAASARPTKGLKAPEVILKSKGGRGRLIKLRSSG